VFRDFPFLSNSFGFLEHLHDIDEMLLGVNEQFRSIETSEDILPFDVLEKLVTDIDEIIDIPIPVVLLVLVLCTEDLLEFIGLRVLFIREKILDDETF
jgi:hypothetical protein